MRTITAMAIHREGDSPIFGESVTMVRLDDEAAGAFLVLEQDNGFVRLELHELNEIVDAAKELLVQEGVKE